jgi:hypothetical protein
MHKYNEVLLRKNAREIRRRLDSIKGLIEEIPDGEENGTQCMHFLQIIDTNLRVVRGIHAQNKGVKMADKNLQGC